MTERPILFNSEMVKAILDGRKSQTRRVVKPQPVGDTSKESGCYADRYNKSEAWAFWFPNNKMNEPRTWKCPYGQPGDRLVVSQDLPKTERFKADTIPTDLTLEILSVRVERLQEISEEDAEAEGAELAGSNDQHGDERNYVEGFEQIWDSIYKPNSPKGWNANPWVWVIEFLGVKV